MFDTFILNSDLKKELLLYNQKRENLNKTKKLLVNDFINMEYSRHMTIIENAFKKFRENKGERGSRTKFIRHTVKIPTKEPMRLPDPEGGEVSLLNRLNLNPQEPDSAAKKEEFFPKLKLQISLSERQEVDSVIDDAFDANDKASRKLSFPQNENSSCLIINPDALELSLQNALNRASRSGSLNMTVGSRIDLDVANKADDLNMLNIQASKKDSEDFDIFRVISPQGKKGSLKVIPEDEGKMKDKRKVILRRLMYFDRQSKGCIIS